MIPLVLPSHGADADDPSLPRASTVIAEDNAPRPKMGCILRMGRCIADTQVAAPRIAFIAGTFPRRREAPPAKNTEIVEAARSAAGENLRKSSNLFHLCQGANN